MGVVSSRLIVVMVTVYAGPYVGGPLYCGGAYDPKRTDGWVALDIEAYRSGTARCGDWIELTFPDGQVLRAPAMDAGTFGGHWIADYPDLPIGADIPQHLSVFPGLSSPATMRNVTAELRAELELRAGR